MAINKCKECGGETSDKAKTCRHCGAPVHSGGIYAMLVLGAVLFILLMIGVALRN